MQSGISVPPAEAAEQLAIRFRLTQTAEIKYQAKELKKRQFDRAYNTDQRWF